MAALAKQPDCKVLDNLDDIVNILSRRDKKKRPASFTWSQVDKEVHRQILYLVADELNLSSPRFIASKHLEKHKFKFLNGSPLNGLYSYYKNNVPRKKGDHIIINICDQLDIPDVDIDDWIHYLKNNNIFSWRNVPNDVKREVLLRACQELGYSHPLSIKNNDFSHRFEFLNGRTLTGFYTYFKNISSNMRGNVIKTMCDTLNIEIREEDWIEYIVSDSTNVFWDIIPTDIMGSILYKSAKQMGYTNPRMMSIDDLKIPINFLNGLTLYSFASRFFGVDKGGTASVDYICDRYEIPQLEFNEWIYLISHHQGYKWERMPRSYINRILIIRANEIGKSNPRMLKYDDICAPCKFLNGKTLSSLYTYFSSIKPDGDGDIINFMCDETGVQPLTIYEWISTIEGPNSKTCWDNIPLSVKKNILIMAANELGLKSPRMMDYKDFCNTRFKFLKGKTLSGLYASYAAKDKNVNTPVVITIYDDLGIEQLTTNDWIEAIGLSNMCRWDSVPLKVQREMIIRSASEMGLPHPRLMGTKEFDSVPLAFLKGKTLCGLYYHYGAKLPNPNMQITQFIFDTLNIPRLDIHPKTGRINTIDTETHNKYFDSHANFKAFVNDYLQHFNMESLCKKYTAINNAKKAGIYKKGLVTVLAPLSKEEYLDYLYEALKNIPRDELGFRKKDGDYTLQRKDLYAIAKVPYHERHRNKIDFSYPLIVPLKEKAWVIEQLKMHKDILNITVQKFHEVPCIYLVYLEETAIFQIPMAFMPGDILTSNTGYEFEVVDCREKKTEDAYVAELRPLSPIQDWEFNGIKSFTRDSNDSILATFMENLIEDVEMDTLSPLMAIVLGLKKEKRLTEQSLKKIPDKEFINKAILTNSAQKQGVELACSLDGKENTIAIIQGPPGTGKTTLIEEIALQYYNKGKNVLIIAKTNVAVDNVLEKLITHKIRVLRTGNNIELKSALPYATTVSTSNARYMAMLADNNRISLGTPMGYYLDKNIDPSEEHYDIVIIDEASQMDIPETLFALHFADKCVMIGDHLQIPPFPTPTEVLLEYDPYMDITTREELQKSLFENLITDKFRFNSLLLDINYRTDNPKMVSLISDLVYDGKLSPNRDSMYYMVPRTKRKKLFPDNLIEVIDTSEFADERTRMETEINATYYNLCEAMLSVKKVLDLVQKGESLNDICIITPYKAHAEKIKEIFMNQSKYFIGYKQPLAQFINKNIYTVDSFQGREQQIVIINWVRSNYSLPGLPTKTGFLRDFRRVNVALSRAKKQLIIIGDFETLTKSDNMKVRYMFSKLKALNAQKKIVL